MTTTAPRRYKLGTEFPYESFVQSAIERHFEAQGFELDTKSDVDLICHHPQTGERWHIEAKGKTSACGLDFRTCLGQLVQHISSTETHYAIAVPDIREYVALVAKVNPWVVSRLRLYWLFVSPDGSVKIAPPGNE